MTFLFPGGEAKTTKGRPPWQSIANPTVVGCFAFIGAFGLIFCRVHFLGEFATNTSVAKRAPARHTSIACRARGRACRIEDASFASCSERERFLRGGENAVKRRRPREAEDRNASRRGAPGGEAKNAVGRRSRDAWRARPTAHLPRSRGNFRRTPRRLLSLQRSGDAFRLPAVFFSIDILSV